MAVNMVRCSKCGSFYNEAVYNECPYCSGADSVNVVDRTAPVDASSATEPIHRTLPGNNYVREDTRTVPVVKKQLDIDIDPVVGWLVAVTGSEQGRDYKIHSDNNYIGRSEHMDITIQGDETISRDNHAIVTYDSRERIFYLTPGEGRSVIRLNGKASLQTAELKAYDRIEIGVTELVFIPLCSENFAWEDEIVPPEEDEQADGILYIIKDKEKNE